MFYNHLNQLIEKIELRIMNTVLPIRNLAKKNTFISNNKLSTGF